MSTAAFVAQYKPMPSAGWIALSEAMLMIEPPFPAAVIARASCFIESITPRRLTAMTMSHVAVS